MIDKYKKELAELKAKLIKAEEFARKLPLFAERIINEKLTGDMAWLQFGENYKTLNCAWGINRGLYTKGTLRSLSNYGSDEYYNRYLFNIYINTPFIYDSHKKYGLDDIQNSVEVFHYDALSSTFYVTDDHIKELLDALVVWKEAACIKAAEEGKQNKIDNLQKELNELIGDKL